MAGCQPNTNMLERDLWNASIAFSYICWLAADYRCAFYGTALQYIWRTDGGRNLECVLLCNETYAFRATQLFVLARFCSTLVPFRWPCKASTNYCDAATACCLLASEVWQAKALGRLRSRKHGQRHLARHGGANNHTYFQRIFAVNIFVTLS